MIVGVTLVFLASFYFFYLSRRWSSLSSITQVAKIAGIVSVAAIIIPVALPFFGTAAYCFGLTPMTDEKRKEVGDQISKAKNTSSINTQVVVLEPTKTFVPAVVMNETIESNESRTVVRNINYILRNKYNDANTKN